MRTFPATWLAAALTAIACPAQAFLTVGPPGTAIYQQIDQALAAAQPGDHVWVLPGVYEPFSATKPVTICGHPGLVTVQPNAGSTTLANLAPTHGELHVHGLQFVQTGLPLNNALHQAVTISGRVTIDRCRFDLDGNSVSLQAADLHLQACDVTVGGLPASLGLPAFVATGSTISCVDSTFETRPTWMVGSMGTVTLFGSRFLASHTLVRGMNGSGATGPAVLLDTGSYLALCDSILEAHDCPIRAAQSAGPTGTVLLARTQQNLTCPGCGPCSIIPATSDLLGVTRTDELRLGGPFAMTVTAQPNTPVFVLAAPKLATVDLPNLLAQPSWLELASYYLAGGVATDASGSASYGFSVPNSQPLLGVTLWLEGVAFGPLPLQVSAPVGGVVTY